MKMRFAVAFASVLCLALAGAALAAEAVAPKPIELKDKVTVKATVVAVDHANRTVTLKGPQGNEVELAVAEDVKRFDNLKVGDIVSAQYYESVAYNVQKPGAAPVPDTVTEQAGKYSGAKPGGGVTDTSTTTVTVVAIDTATPAITIRTSDGAIKSFFVRHPEYLKEVKVGDKVVVTKTTALMIAVDAAK